MRQAFPDATGFSHTNVKYMKRWYLFYFKQVVKSQRVVGQIDHQVGDQFGKKEKSQRVVDRTVAELELKKKQKEDEV